MGYERCTCEYLCDYGKQEIPGACQCFFDDFVMKPLSQKIDPMPGKHSNTNVPKAIGCARLYELTGSDTDKTVAAYFWQLMVHDHSYVIGGNSNYEYCGAAGKLNDQLSDATCETCNTYNMLKLTKHLFEWQPTAELGDYYERALYNHILASQNPDDGMMCYFVPLRMGTKSSSAIHSTLLPVVLEAVWKITANMQRASISKTKTETCMSIFYRVKTQLENQAIQCYTNNRISRE